MSQVTDVSVVESFSSERGVYLRKESTFEGFCSWGSVSFKRMLA